MSQVRGEQAESMVYYVDKIQDLETEIARLRSLRSSDKLKQLRDAAEEGGEEAEEVEDGEQSGSDEALADCQQGKGNYKSTFSLKNI